MSAPAAIKPRRNRKPVQTFAGVRDTGKWKLRKKTYLEEDLRPIGIGASLAYLEKLLNRQPAISPQ